MRAIGQFILSARFHRGVARVVVSLIAVLVQVNVANAGCMAAPTQELRRFTELAGRDPAAVLAATERDHRGTMDALRFGWRQAARAEAYDVLSRPADARRIAERMLMRDMKPTSPLQVELLARYAMNGFSADEIAAARRAVETARQRQARGSAADACLQIALGEMQRMQGAPERAVVHLTQAYRMTSDPDMEQQHILATEKLARVMDWAGDHRQAISLVEEVIARDQARGRKMALSNDYYFRGTFNLGREAYHEALVDFEQARALAPSDVDPVGAAFLDLQTCATLIAMNVFDRAKLLCQQAEKNFSSRGQLGAGQAQLLLAQIAARDEPALALAILNRLLASDDVLSSFASAPKAYRLRSDVNRKLGRTGAAYSDLDVYVRATDRQRASEQMRQNAVLRASLDADRAAARNLELQRSLAFSKEREREQAKRYTMLSLSASIGAVLLLVILGMGIYHRRKLVQISNTDPLTGLRNRRFINEHEGSYVGDHARTGRSLTVAIIDLDHFKFINDTYGHSVGDEVLIAFASLARGVLRQDDVIARWGGEEFIVISPNTTRVKAVDALERLQSALASGITTAVGRVSVSFSAGVASFQGTESLQAIVRRADEALYRAKETGRNRVELAGK
ncbi:diguanylate cyclase [Sphingomonas sp. LB3N6]|uniref:GGDEF domain-containing protein n=1 Tax=Sphingomonas fucosidasi TaxID=3096164 RepID=UPI002FC8B102